LVTVTDLAALVVPTTFLNERLAGKNVSAPADPEDPLPIRFTTWGLNTALWLMVNPPRIKPDVLGVNVTLIVHLENAARLPLQGVLPPGPAE